MNRFFELTDHLFLMLKFVDHNGQLLLFCFQIFILCADSYQFLLHRECLFLRLSKFIELDLCAIEQLFLAFQ